MYRDLHQSHPHPFNALASARASCGVGMLVDVPGRASHDMVAEGLSILLNLDHRGARGAEENTGDGAGMLLQKPHAFFSDEIKALGDADGYGVGQLFMPADASLRRSVMAQIDQVVEQSGFRLHAWRPVPTDRTGLGYTALKSEPCVMQCFVIPDKPMRTEQMDVRLYILRHRMEKAVHDKFPGNEACFYICSLHRRHIVYKGLLTAQQLASYYSELCDDRVMSSFVLVHSRFSTNTLGAWQLAHPYRCSLHNGEINTLRGNLNAMITRQQDLYSECFGDNIADIIPVTREGQSDTAVLDNVLELLIESGRSLPHALRMLIPEAWEKDRFMPKKRRAFYEYHAHLMEPWDGPALVAASDGDRVAAILDRNGLRPCRYYLTRDQRLVMASEAGVLPIAEEDIVARGRLRPGELIMVDTLQGHIVYSDDVFQQLAAKPYAGWLAQNSINIDALCGAHTVTTPPALDADLQQYQRLFDYTSESLRYLVRPMAETGKDPVGSMGNDMPPAVLSERNKSLFQYFSQTFAQVSNPPLDYIREDLVTSLQCPVGRKGNLLTEGPGHCRQLTLNSPILSDTQIHALRGINHNGMRSIDISMCFAPNMDLQSGIERLRRGVVNAIREGFEIIILSDRDASPRYIPIPALLAVSAVHHDLIRRGLRTRAALILDSAHPHTVHHVCTLLGYGADAVYPWLACLSIRQMVEQHWLDSSEDDAIDQYRHALEGGLLKVMAKMGISTLASYKGAQVFEITGLDRQLVNEYFYGTPAHIPGVSLQHLEQTLKHKHHTVFADPPAGNLMLEQGGELYWRRDGEVHHWNPYTIGRLQHAVQQADADAYAAFAAYSNEQDTRLHTLRGLLEFDIDPDHSVAIDRVEPVSDIVKRFATASMSFGALSREAHETLAIAMNRLGAKSASGEGGEQVERFGTEKACSIKQVASGRFGVDIDYLNQAREIEIKMAQGSKPGEGGELPGDKVDEDIARVRFTVPGVGLISPPPHHDIYSIEDLAQLIHDLKCANPRAAIHVKLVAEHGVGTIAAGVSKARADTLLISGDAGGTGASVKTSIKSAGCAWELGLAETQQVLLANNLRSRIRLRVDGGLRTGRDVVIAALLGAEEFAFGTAPLVTLGCVMLRKCHCNTCSVGVATQDPALRRRFAGQPEHVINYMLFVAREVRELMAQLGFTDMDAMIGRVDRLRRKKCTTASGVNPDLSELLYRQPSRDSPYKTRAQQHKLDQQLEYPFIEPARRALMKEEPFLFHTAIRNHDRSFGALLSSMVSRQFGTDALSDDRIRVLCTGSAGQSFGAFLARGITLYLEGDTNDYPGKGLSGGRIIVRTPRQAVYKAEHNIIIGNVALYGATRGECYVNGIAGERFAVRNSGALAVVEGVGNHGCEYMTGGVVVILGETGYNFAAGMSGGEVFVYDPNEVLARRLNMQQVHLQSCDSSHDMDMLYRLLENHYAYTHSDRARRILDDWLGQSAHFVKVVADAYERVVRDKLAQGVDVRPPMPPRARQPRAA